MRFGICMEGLEDFFEKQLLRSKIEGECFSYLEIGVASCETLLSAATSICIYNERWKCIGVDLSDGFTNNHKDEIKHSVYSPKFVYRVEEPSLENAVTVYLVGADEFLFRNTMMFNCVFIDGCHCRTCAAKNFTSCEQFVKKGGCVMFHDAGMEEQGGCPQYGHGNIEVYNALGDVDLLQGARKGWSALSWKKGESASIAATFRL